MTTRISLLLAAILTLSAACSKSGDAAAGNAQAFRADKDLFAIAFPGTPEVAEHQPGAGILSARSYLLADGGDITYLVSCETLSQEAVDEPTAMRELTEGRLLTDMKSIGASSVDQEGGTFVGENEAFTYRIRGPQDAIVAKILLVGSRLYSIRMLSKGTYPAEDKIKAFMDSFALQPAS